MHHRRAERMSKGVHALRGSFWIIEELQVLVAPDHSHFLMYINSLTFVGGLGTSISGEPVDVHDSNAVKARLHELKQRRAFWSTLNVQDSQSTGTASNALPTVLAPTVGKRFFIEGGDAFRLSTEQRQYVNDKFGT